MRPALTRGALPWSGREKGNKRATHVETLRWDLACHLAATHSLALGEPPCSWAGQRLARASNVLPAFLVHLCFSLPHGFIQGALQVQKTDAIFFLRTCVSIACVCTCGISGYCRQLWRCCRLEPLPCRRAMMARSAQSQGSVALRAVCSKDMEQRWPRTSEANMCCQTAGRGGAILPKRCYYVA